MTNMRPFIADMNSGTFFFPWRKSKMELVDPQPNDSMDNVSDMGWIHEV